MSEEGEGRLSWKESNLAAIGSDLDHKIKAAAADGEDAWKVIGEAPGIKVWRIEHFKVVPWHELGCFYKGDSYIVLNSWHQEGADKLNHGLYIWIGSESSQDEYGTAAYKMVEADDYVGGIAVQHREVQGHESSKFCELFDGDHLTYWNGGISSGFNHVEPTLEKPHMYKIKGTHKKMSLTQVPLEKEAMNEGDSFVLKASPAKVWLWNGEHANPDEKSRAIKFAEKLCTEGTVKVLDQGAGDEEESEFWAYLKEGDIKEAVDDDHMVEEFTPLLFKLPEGDDDLDEPEQIGKGEKVRIGFTTQCKISKDLLDESDVFLLDAGWELFLWIGKNADRSEKLGAMARADKYCHSDLRTTSLSLTVVKSGYEQSDFNNFFA